MTVVGVGTDILEIERVREVISKQGNAFIEKIFTESEQAYCRKHNDPVPYYAVRFSAKESIAKALGCGFGDQIGFLDIEVSHDKAGKPVVHFSTKAMKKLNNPHVILSMSHCKSYVSTVAISLEK